MKIYLLRVSFDDFEYDDIADASVLAETPEQAIAIAKESRNVKWEIEKIIELDRPKLIDTYIQHG